MREERAGLESLVAVGWCGWLLKSNRIQMLKKPESAASKRSLDTVDPGSNTALKQPWSAWNGPRSMLEERWAPGTGHSIRIQARFLFKTSVIEPVFRAAGTQGILLYFKNIVFLCSYLMFYYILHSISYCAYIRLAWPGFGAGLPWPPSFSQSIAKQLPELPRPLAC